jgi:hypothetical protein
MPRRRHLLAVASLAATLTTLGVPSVPAADAGGAPSCPLPKFGPGSSYHPTIDPQKFSAHVTNQWFPLRVGTTWIYAGVQDGKKSTDIVTVSHRTRRIDGVETRVVRDRLLLANRLEERTDDYYSQDACGNVWYFGEDTAELDAHGNVTNTDGSFHAGVNGAQPGVFMQAHPTLDRKFRQEWYRGQAEDSFAALSRTASRTVPYGSFHGNVLRTREWSALEPGVIDNKYYVRGIGEVDEVTVKGPREFAHLIDVLH